MGSTAWFTEVTPRGVYKATRDFHIKAGWAFAGHTPGYAPFFEGHFYSVEGDTLADAVKKGWLVMEKPSELADAVRESAKPPPRSLWDHISEDDDE